MRERQCLSKEDCIGNDSETTDDCSDSNDKYIPALCNLYTQPHVDRGVTGEHVLKAPPVRRYGLRSVPRLVTTVRRRRS